MEKQTLGAYLIEKGKLSKSQLDQAVQCQVLFGGRLATNLLELGHISPEDLLQALAEKYEVKPVSFNELEHIPEAVIKLVSSEVAQRYQLIPYRREENNLYLAMLNPDDTKALLKISQLTGLNPVACVVLELDWRWAMERYYGIKREARFIQLEKTLNLTREEPLPERSVVSFPDTGSVIEKASSSDFLLQPEPKAKSETESVAQEEPPKTLEEFWEKAGRTSHPKFLVPVIKKELSLADSRDKIAQVILDVVTRILPRVALFYIKSGVVFGWKGRGERMSDAHIAGIMIPLELQSVFKLIYETGSYYLGPVPESSVNYRILLALGGIAPSTVLLLPIKVEDKVVAIIYGDWGREPRKELDLSLLQELVTEVSYAFQRLIKKQKES